MNLKLIRFEDDRCGGPYMPTCVFTYAGIDGELHVTDSFYGASFYVNPGPKVQSFDYSKLTPEEVTYMWNCFKINKKKNQK